MLAKNGNTLFGVVCGRDRTHLLAVRGKALAGASVAEVSFDDLFTLRGKQAFLAAAAELTEKAGAQKGPAYISLPNDKASLHTVAMPQGKAGPLAANPMPPLERLTPLGPDEVRYDWRGLGSGSKKGPRKVQAALVKKEIAEGLSGLVKEAGLSPRALDVEASYAMLAAARLAPAGMDSVLLYLGGRFVFWGRLTQGKLVESGSIRAGRGSSPMGLALRACQHVTEVCGLDRDADLFLSGPGAEEAMAACKGMPVSGGGEDILFRPRLLGPAAGGGGREDWERFAMLGFLTAGKANPKTLFNLLPPAAGASWLAGPGATRKLAWAAALLALAWVLQGGIASMWEYQKAHARMEAAQAEIKDLKERKKKTAAGLRKYASFVGAERARTDAAGLLEELRRFLPARGWVERMEYDGELCTLYLGGVTKAQAARMFPAKGRLRASGPVKQVTAPGSGKPALKVALQLREGKAVKRPPKRTPAKANRRRPARGQAPRAKAPKSTKPMYTPGLPQPGRPR